MHFSVRFSYTDRSRRSIIANLFRIGIPNMGFKGLAIIYCQYLFISSLSKNGLLAPLLFKLYQ